MPFSTIRCPGVSLLEEAVAALGLKWDPEPQRLRLPTSERPWPVSLEAALLEEDEEVVTFAVDNTISEPPVVADSYAGTDCSAVAGVIDCDSACWCVFDSASPVGFAFGGDGARLLQACSIAAVRRFALLTECGVTGTLVDSHGSWIADLIIIEEEEGATMKKVTVKVSPDGQIVKVEVDGVQGPGCTKLTTALQNALGGVVVTEDKKPEYFNQDNEILAATGG